MAMAQLEARYCPECGMPAWIEWQDGADSAGDLGLVKVRCFARHWFLMPSAHLDATSGTLTNRDLTLRRPA